MTCTIALFAKARELAGAATIDVTLEPNATVADLRCTIAANYPTLGAILGVSRIALNHEFAHDDTPIPPSAELAIIPPVSGG